MTDQYTELLRNAGLLNAKKVVEPVEISALPALHVASMPPRKPWRMTIERDSATGLIAEIICTPIEA